MTEPKPKAFEQWCIVEIIMGHQSVVGSLQRGTDRRRNAAARRRSGWRRFIFTTQYVGGGSIYRLRVVSEEVARKLSASRRDHVPPFAWELNRPAPSLLPATDKDDDDDDGRGDHLMPGANRHRPPSTDAVVQSRLSPAGQNEESGQGPAGRSRKAQRAHRTHWRDWRPTVKGCCSRRRRCSK